MRFCWVVVAAAVLLCGCEPEIGRILWLAGDSTALETLEELHLAASARDRGDIVIPVAAIPASALGRDLGYFTGRFESARAPSRLSAPSVVIVSLGTNDTIDGMPPLQAWPLMDTAQKAAAALDAFIAALPAGVRLIWVVPGGPMLQPERQQHIARALADARTRWPNLELLVPDPLWFTGTGEDGIHFTVEGEFLLAKALVARIDQGPDVKSGPTQLP